MRYVYASEAETVSCRCELLQRLREERTAINLSIVLDDESVFGADLVNDVEVATAVASDDAMSETTDTSMEQMGPAMEEEVMLVRPVLTDDECDLMSCLPEPDDVPSGCEVTCNETCLESEEEEDFFDTLRD